MDVANVGSASTGALSSPASTHVPTPPGVMQPSSASHALSVASFESMLVRQEQIMVEAPSTLKSMLGPLEKLDAEAVSFHEHASKVIDNKADMSPSEIVMLTAKSQEFLFYSQMTASVANRSADGIQQLFRQQA